MSRIVTIIKSNGKKLVSAIDKDFVLKNGDKMECDLCLEVPEVKASKPETKVAIEENEESFVRKIVRKTKKSTKKK